MPDSDTRCDASPGSGACACGTPSRRAFVGMPATAPSAPAGRRAIDSRHLIEQVRVPAGRFVMGDSSGDANPADGELPRHEVAVPEFTIDATTVTNADFARFVADTGYRTEAEVFGFSAVFHLALDAPAEDVIGRASGTPWWLGVRGADWAHPSGRHSSVDASADHPVVHVTWNDAQAYCAWAGRRLPTEAEWEYAARGGLADAKYPWGDEEVDAGGWRANIWQGSFPGVNTCDDGYLTTAPVRSFARNGYGLWQAVGNVWEWCEDWFSRSTYAQSVDASPAVDPRGPARGTGRILRGGSYLCHDSYCNRYRNSARSSNTADSSMGNAGFRTVSLRSDQIAVAADTTSSIRRSDSMPARAVAP